MNSGTSNNLKRTGSSSSGVGARNMDDHIRNPNDSHPSQGMDNIWGNSPEFSTHSPSTASNHLHSLINPPADVNNDVTPSILLEQLAFVDNFITDFNSDFGPNVTNSFYNNEGPHGDTVNSFGGMPLNHQIGGLSADNQLAMDERLAAELSVFADETFIFPDEDKADRHDSDDNGDHYNSNHNFGLNNNANPSTNDNNIDNNNNNNSGNNNNSNNNNNNDNNNNNNNSNNRNSSEKRNLFDRKSNLLGNQYDHTRQRFSRKRSSTQNSPIPDHGGFTHFDVQDQSNSHNTGNLNGTSANRQRDMPFATSPLTNLLAAYDLTSVSYPSNTTVSSASSIVNTVSNHGNNHANSNENPYRPSTAATSGFESNIQMPDYSTIQTATLVSLLPIINVPRGAYQSLRNVGFKPEQIDAIAAIMAYYEREREKFDPPVRKPTNLNNHSTNRPPSSASHLGSSIDVNSQNQLVPEPQEHIQSSVGMLLDFLHEKPEPSPQSSIHEPNPKRVKKTPVEKESRVIDTYMKNSPKVHHGSTSNNIKKESEENSAKQTPDDDISKTPKSVVRKLESASSLRKDVTSANLKEEVRQPEELLNDKENAAKSLDEKINEKKHNTDSDKNNSSSDVVESSSTSLSLPSRPKLPNLDQTKKLKEKEMETWVQDLSQLACDLKQRINTLEMENRLLKNLVIERGDLKNIESYELSKNNSSESTKKDTDK